MKRYDDNGDVFGRYGVAVRYLTLLVLVFGAVLMPLSAAHAQDVRQKGPGYGISRRAANKAAAGAGRTDWPTLGDDGTTGTQVHVSFDARNADVTLVTPGDYAQSKLLRDAQTIAPRLGFPRADYLVYDNTKTSVVDMEFNKYLRPLSRGSGAAFELPLTRLAVLLSASSLPRPIVLYVSGEAADEIQIIGANGKNGTIGAAYFVGADEASARGKNGEETLRFRAQISPLSYLVAFGMGGMVVFLLATMARLPWIAARTKQKAAQKKAEPVPDPAEVQRRYNAQKPHWVMLVTTFVPFAAIPLLVIGLRGHGMAQVITNGFLLLPPAFRDASPAAFPAFMMGGTLGVFGLSWAVCALVERRKKNALNQAETAEAEKADKAENPMRGFANSMLVIMATVIPLMFLLPFLPRSVRVALGPAGVQSLITGIMVFGAAAVLLVVLRDWRKERTTLLPGNPWHDMVKEVARQAGDVPVRHVVLTRSPSANASASVFNTVSLTSGLLEKLEPNEVRVVVAHEVAHLKGGHTKKTLLVSLGVLVAYLLVLWLVVFPLKSRIDPVAYAMLSSPLPGILLGNLLTPLLVGRGRRKREHEADQMAAHITGDTELVIHTLRKLHTLSASPHHLKRSDELLSSHPSLSHRIEALRQTG